MRNNLTILTIVVFAAFLLCNTSTATTLNSTATSKISSAYHYTDLTVTEVKSPLNGIKGNTIIISNTIKNQGNTASKGFYVNYYLKTSPQSPNNHIGKRYIAGLAPGASNNQNTKITIPTTIPANSYYILTYADFTNQIPESNETNNAKYSSTKINILNCRPVYITSDYIKNTTVDNARINSIVTGLRTMGLIAVNYGLGPGTHSNIILDTKIPKNALIVNIYGGACAGTIWEMTQSWYKYYKGNRSVFSIWINTPTNITNITFLQRAHDDNFTPLYNSSKPGAFPTYNDKDKDGIFDYDTGYINGIIYPTKFNEIDGIVYPAKLLLNNGYHYLYQQNGDINTIVQRIIREATTTLIN